MRSYRSQVMAVCLLALLTACNLESPQSPTRQTTPETPQTAPTQGPTATFTRDPNLTPTSLLPPTWTATPPGGIPPTPAATAAPDIPFPATFQGGFPVTVRAGQTLILNYSVTIDNPGRGRVFFVLRDPSGADVWRLAVTETADTSADITISASGEHQLLVASEDLDGQYSISFDFR